MNRRGNESVVRSGLLKAAEPGPLRETQPDKHDTQQAQEENE